MNYNSRECNITRGNDLLLAGRKYYSRERIITRGNLFITRGNDILLAGEKYWQYMAPEGFRSVVFPGYTTITDVMSQWLSPAPSTATVCHSTPSKAS